jgi:hypothetical protein
MAFQKYQGEQVQQIPAGYVEAMGSMGKAYANIGQSIAGGIIEADKRAQEEAKIQGGLSIYLRNDPRNKAVESALSTGLLKKDAEGNVIVPEENANKLDLATATSAIDFYNKTGGDGTKLKGADLTRFATQFEAQRKYDAEQATKDEKRLEQLKTLAEIRKMEAEANEKAAATVGNSIVANYASGGSVPIASAPAPAPSVLSQVGASAPAPAVSLTASRPSFPTVETPTYGTTPGFTAPLAGFSVDRYNAGMELAGQLRSAPTEAPKPVTDIPVAKQEPIPLPAPVEVTAKPETVIAAQEAERTVITTRYSERRSAAEADYARSLAQLAASGSASPERIKSLKEVHEVKMANLKNGFDASVALIDSRIKAATTITAEARAVAGETRAEAGETRAKAKEGRDVEAEKRAAEAFNIEQGTPIQPGTKPAKTTGEAKPGTFKAMVSERVEGAGTIPGRTGGTKSREAREQAYTIHQKRMSDYPAIWGLGVFHEGAKEYQVDLSEFPVASPVDPSIRAKVNENIGGYSEAQTFLQKLNDVVNSTDDNAITNYLNRSLWTARQDSKDTTVEGAMMNQFGVAAFRRAIVSGGNFSDADREYVAKLITDINSAHLRKDKALMQAQTRSLAKFIDSKYRSELAGQNIRFDVKTAKDFLTREGNQAGLEQLSKTEQYVKAFGIDTGNTTAPGIPDVETPSRLDALAKRAADAGNQKLAEELTAKANQMRATFAKDAEQAKAKVKASERR